MRIEIERLSGVPRRISVLLFWAGGEYDTVDGGLTAERREERALWAE
ncbi:hypothetical protein KP014_26495 [Paenibacillus sophorae]|uniref:Phage tail protein n=1 Tax=Paenibacillus sophorae TaxID=1333845 RepID=A0ABX8HAW8_9BACL|nr:hypothetical protein [Paenibacillus sophorae]QWU15384.1 hypothetical protein KP014_26495 [Paenibacillus sophorae]